MALKKPNYQCPKCGFTYDPESGLADAGIKKGTPFEEVKQTWKCPGCGNPKSKFNEIEDPIEAALKEMGKYYEGAPKRIFEHED